MVKADGTITSSRTIVEERQIRGGYLRAYETVSEAKAHLGTYLDFYNRRRSHRRLTVKYPMRSTSHVCRDKHSWHVTAGRHLI